jgi:hypothetical protein
MPPGCWQDRLDGRPHRRRCSGHACVTSGQTAAASSRIATGRPRGAAGPGAARQPEAPQGPGARPRGWQGAGAGRGRRWRRSRTFKPPAARRRTGTAEPSAPVACGGPHPAIKGALVAIARGTFRAALKPPGFAGSAAVARPERIHMDRIRIRGGRPLAGTVSVTGAKNAALPLMAASLLGRHPADPGAGAGPGRHRHHGAAAGRTGRHDPPRRRYRRLDAGTINDTTAPYDLVRKMRASVLVLGPLLARCGRGAGLAARRLRHRHAARSTCT